MNGAERAPVIVSGGQSGVDRAALDAALELGLACGGWCPRGRLAEDGPIPERYPLRETPSADPAQRTEWNVRDSDATLILVAHPGGSGLRGGTALTRELALRYGRRIVVAGLADARVDDVRRELELAALSRLNVAGPRESQSPGIHAAARRFLLRLLARGTG